MGTRRTITLKGKPLALLGPEIKVGQKAPNFKLLAIGSTIVELSQSKGKVRLLSVVHSLDTNVCDLQTQRFEEEAQVQECHHTAPRLRQGNRGFEEGGWLAVKIGRLSWSRLKVN